CHRRSFRWAQIDRQVKHTIRKCRGKGGGNSSNCRPGAGRDPPLCARDVENWIPACAGMTTWKAGHALERRASTLLYLPREQFLDGGVDEGGVFRVERRVAGAMAPDRRNRP